MRLLTDADRLLMDGLSELYRQDRFPAQAGARGATVRTAEAAHRFSMQLIATARLSPILADRLKDIEDDFNRAVRRACSRGGAEEGPDAGLCAPALRRVHDGLSVLRNELADMTLAHREELERDAAANTRITLIAALAATLSLVVIVLMRLSAARGSAGPSRATQAADLAAAVDHKVRSVQAETMPVPPGLPSARICAADTSRPSAGTPQRGEPQGLRAGPQRRASQGHPHLEQAWVPSPMP
ncbi:hypothetical protein [Azorhizobium caulinodans]|nr:hypothetical protein [Azorhizobium caulinodans]